MTIPAESIIRRSWLFKDLTNEELKPLFDLGELKTVSPGTVMFRPGEGADHCYVVGEGIVQLQVPPPWDAIHPPVTATMGDILGWGGFIEPFHYFFTAVAVTDVTLVAFPGDVLGGFMEQHPDIGYRFVRLIVAYMGREIQRVLAMTLMTQPSSSSG